MVEQDKQEQQQQGTMAKLAPLLIVITGICWGCIGLFVRPLSEAGLSSFQMSWLRSICTVAMMLVLVLVKDPSLLRFKLRDIWCFLGTGLVSVVFFTICYYTTISLTSLSVAATLMYTAPAFVLFMSYLFFKESITPVKIFAVVLIVVGCAFVGGLLAGAPQLNLFGFLVGLGSGFGYAMYSIFSRFALERDYHPLTIAIWTFVFATIGSTFLVNPIETTQLACSSLTTAAYVLGFALVNSVTPYVLYTTALQYVENSRAAVIVSIEPVVASLVGVFAFGEALTWFNVVGIVLVLVAVALLSRKE